MSALPTTPKFDRVVAQSHLEALHRRDRYVGTEHLVLALLRVGSGKGYELLSDSRLTSEKIERRLSK